MKIESTTRAILILGVSVTICTGLITAFTSLANSHANTGRIIMYDVLNNAISVMSIPAIIFSILMLCWRICLLMDKLIN